MDPTDREVLALRHFEQLTNAEAAQVLGIQERAAAKRYLRALERLKDNPVGDARRAHGGAAMSEPTAALKRKRGDELLAELADDFLRRYRAGEHPSVDEYADEAPGAGRSDPRPLPRRHGDGAAGVGATLDFAPPTERVGAIIGRYKLLERIGEGGFGVVYMAEQQQPVRRKVALKVIKPGMDTRQVIARFEAERQALALMDHPNIAKVLDAGATDSGRPYFVMELVHGVPITEYCDQNQLPPRERLELFVQVCRAVQHAHTKGIIHRDIKPTNVLVTLHDGVPVPKVIDFGVAKATGQQLTDKTLFTQLRADGRHAAVHEPRAGGDDAASTWTRAATSTAWACCCTSC